MENILLKSTPKTPAVELNKERGFLELKGRSIPENSIEFYKPLLDWIEAYSKSPVSRTEFNIKLEYFNTSSSKCLLDMLKKLERIRESELLIKWYYEQDDEDMLEAGQDYEAIVRIPFKMIEVSELE